VIDIRRNMSVDMEKYVPENEVAKEKSVETPAVQETERILLEQKLNAHLEEEGVSDKYQALVVRKPERKTIVRVFDPQGNLVKEYEYEKNKFSIKG